MTKLTKVCGQVVLVFIAISINSVSGSAQERKISERQVPAAVIAAFKSAYPAATVKGYAREKENGKVFYEIESKDGDTRRDVLYNSDGSIAEIEETISAGDLPAAAQDMIQSRHKGAIVSKAERTTQKTAQGEKVGYEVILKQGKRRISLGFDANGKLKSK